MELSCILDILCGILPLGDVELSAHNINRNRERAVGLFPRGRGVSKVGAIGGQVNSGYSVARLTMLIRWGREGIVAENAAWEIYRAVAERNFDGGFVIAAKEAPVWLGMDDRGVFEYVVDFDAYIRKGEVNYGFSGE